PCYQELAMLSAAQRQQAFNLVLIAVDGADARSEVEAVLAKHQFKTVSAWLFEEAGAPHLRHEIDPLWYGELPRSYLFDTHHQRQAVSGLLRRAQLFQRQSR
ncbi:MAG: TlpA family protein disulfide reductase, partial [Gammaproteobacteria bacterium]